MKLLDVRKKMKSKKPGFLRQDAHKRIGPKKAWRKPKGIQSKMRLGHRGYNVTVKPGYRSPVAVRGLERSGLKAIRVSTVKELATVDKSKQTVLVAKVGNKKKITILEKAIELGLPVQNIKDPKACIDHIKKSLEERKQSQKQKKDKRAASKKKVQKEKKTEKKTKEEKKKEQDKLLIKKEK